MKSKHIHIFTALQNVAEEFAAALGVTRQAIHRSKALKLFQKLENQMPHELKPGDVENRFFICDQLLQRQKRQGFFASYYNMRTICPHIAQPVKTYLETLKYEVLTLLSIDAACPGWVVLPLTKPKNGSICESRQSTHRFFRYMF